MTMQSPCTLLPAMAVCVVLHCLLPAHVSHVKGVMSKTQKTTDGREGVEGAVHSTAILSRYALA